MKRVLVGVVLAACSSPDPKTPVAGLPMCSGQTADSTATSTTARDGAMPLQLAPSFLDRMAVCTTHDAQPRPDLVDAGAGSVTAKGDCEWTNGVSCHFHLGAEFVDSRAPRPRAAELHCIFPSGEPKSPHVYGTHFTCKAGTSLSSAQAQACGANLLPTLAAMMGHCDARCCDDGTLTGATEARRAAGTLDVRPDFRICAAAAELDCGMFAGMIGHSANAPRFGPPVDNAM